MFSDEDKIRMLINCGIPEKFVKKKKTYFDEKFQKGVERYIKSFPSEDFLFIYDKEAFSRNSIKCAFNIAVELGLHQNKIRNSVFILDLAQVLLRPAAFSQYGSDFDTTMDKLGICDLFILKDLGAVSLTDRHQTLIYSLISNCVDKRKPIIITSPEVIDNLKNTLGKSIYLLITQHFKKMYG